MRGDSHRGVAPIFCIDTDSFRRMTICLNRSQKDSIFSLSECRETINICYNKYTLLEYGEKVRQVK